MSNRDAANTASTEADAGSTSDDPVSAVSVSDEEITPDEGIRSDKITVPESEEKTESDDRAGELVVVCGLPGVGKSTVAARVAGHLDAEVLRTDVIRKELFSDPSYSDEETESVYEELLERARDRVVDGHAVVLDATFADERFRRDVRRMADEAADRFELVKVECEESVVKRRIERRDGISDADFDIHLRFKELFDGIDTDHVVVDNSGREAATVDQIDAAFDQSEVTFD